MIPTPALATTRGSGEDVSGVELQTKVREHLTITVKAATKGYSWLKYIFTLKTLYYEKWALTHGNKGWAVWLA